MGGAARVTVQLRGRTFIYSCTASDDLAPRAISRRSIRLVLLLALGEGHAARASGDHAAYMYLGHGLAMGAAVDLCTLTSWSIVSVLCRACVLFV